MNIHRNVLKITASLMLVATLPAGAQVLGGGGALNGALGGGFGAPGIGGTLNGSTGATGNGSFDATGVTGAARERAQQAGGRVRGAATSTTEATRSKAETARNSVATHADVAQAATAEAGHSAGESVTAAGNDASQEASPTNPQPQDGLLLGGSGSARAEKRALGRTVSADGNGASETRADRSGVHNTSAGKSDVSVKKDEPVQTETQPAE